MRKPVLLVFALLLAATSCRADISTTLNVDGDGTTAITAGFTATGTLAEALHDTAVERQVLSALISSRADTPTELRLVDGEVHWDGELTYSQLISSRDLTGVGDAVVQVSDDRVTAAVGTFRPVDLLGAFIESAASRPDGADVAAAYAANTFINLTVSVPHDAAVVSLGALDVNKIRVETTDTSVTIVASVDNWKETVIVVSGARSAPFSFAGFLRVTLFVMVGVVVMGAAAGRWAHLGPLQPRRKP